MKMKKNSAIAVFKAAAVVLALILPLAGCNFFGIPEYQLSVTVEPGVTGTPTTRTELLADLTEVEYAYTPVNSLHTVEVIFNGSQATASGTVTMYRDITLEARLVDVRDAWLVKSYKTDGTAIETFTITLAGSDILGGTFSDSRGYSGTWTGASNKVVITFSNWENYIFTGTLFSMSGSWANGSAAGTWSADRVE